MWVVSRHTGFLDLSANEGLEGVHGEWPQFDLATRSPPRGKNHPPRAVDQAEGRFAVQCSSRALGRAKTYQARCGHAPKVDTSFVHEQRRENTSVSLLPHTFQLESAWWALPSKDQISHDHGYHMLLWITNASIIPSQSLAQSMVGQTIPPLKGEFVVSKIMTPIPKYRLISTHHHRHKVTTNEVLLIHLQHTQVKRLTYTITDTRVCILFYSNHRWVPQKMRQNQWKAGFFFTPPMEKNEESVNDKILKVTAKLENGKLK